MNDPSEVYYVVLRGAGRQPLFDDAEDYRHFTRVVAEAAAACGLTVHAYCWLRAEARLAVQIGDVPISHFSELVASTHTRRLKRQVELTGSHFEPQYRGVRVDGPAELPHLVRHVHLAPLKARLADDPAEYPWSSHLVYLGLATAPWVTTEDTLKHFADSGPDPRVGYMEFIQQGVSQLDLPPPAAAHEPDGPGDALRKK